MCLGCVVVVGWRVRGCAFLCVEGCVVFLGWCLRWFSYLCVRVWVVYIVDRGI